MTSASFWRRETAAEMARTVCLRLTAASGEPRHHLLTSAAEWLVRFHVQALAEHMPDAEVERHVQAIHAALVPVAEPMRCWGIWALGVAQNGRYDAQFDAAVARSAFAFLLRDHAHDPTIARMSEEVDELDEELARMIESYGPLSERLRPTPIPPGHWWWTDNGHTGGVKDDYYRYDDEPP